MNAPKTTTPRENLLRVLKGEPPAWIPVTGHCDPHNQPGKQGMDPELARTLADVQWGDESTVAFSRYLGLDVADWCGAGYRMRHHKVTVTTQKDDPQGTIITTWQTAKGELRRVQQYSADTGLHYIAEHQVKDRADLARLACVFEDIEYYSVPEERAFHRSRQQHIGDNGIKLCSIVGTPLGELIRGHAGVETTAYLWADARREMHELFRVMEDSHRRLLDVALTVDNDAIVTVDDTSTTTQSPAMFEEFCLGYTDRMADIAHAAGRFYLHHSCGLIRDLLPLYRQTRMDAVHAFTVPPVGNVTVAEGRRRLGPDITIFAGLPATCCRQVSTNKRTEAAHEIETLFRDAAPGDRFILGLAPEPINTMDDMAFIVRECRKYQWKR